MTYQADPHSLVPLPMQPKRILTAVLIVFLAFSVGGLVAKRVRGASADGDAGGDSAVRIRDGVVAYFCHSKDRCANCLNLEAYAKEIITGDFAQPLAEGQLAWQVVDFDEPANAHFDNDYQLGHVATLVLVHVQDGQQVGEPNVLRDGLMYVALGERKEFDQYVRTEVTAFLANQEIADADQTTAARQTAIRERRGYLVGLAWALGLGIFTSIMPCPLATNVAAVSYVGRRVGRPRQVILAGLLYALGRTLAYVALGSLLVAGLLASAEVSSFLRKYMNELLGPLLILVAMFLLDMVRIGGSGLGVSEKMQRRIDAMGVWGALLLGIAFALAFCPLSAGLFFFQLVPESAYLGSYVGLPGLYGIGTAIPVVAFTLVLVYSAESLGRVFNRVTQVQGWIQRIGAVAFLAVGIYFTLVYVFDVAGA
jgi:cytochrome c-type biogenesis protein